MDNPIKKSKRILPKVFRVFTLYIFVTLAVFFGYVQIFGGIAPSTISLPTGNVDAQEDSAFGELVENIMQVRSLYVDDFNLQAEVNGHTLAMQGDLAFVTETKMIYIDLDLVYDDRVFDVGAVYTSPNLYLSVEDETYLLEVEPSNSTDFDVNAVMEVVTNYLPFDVSTLTDKLADLGIDLDNPAALMEKLSITEKEQEDGSFDFRVGLGNVISVQILTDENYNIESVRMRDVQINKNGVQAKIGFAAPHITMNNEEIASVISAPTDYIDLSGITTYVGYTKNLVSEDVVKIDASVEFDGKNYDATITIDKTNDLKVKAQTTVENVDVAVVYADEMIYLDVENLKFKFAVVDYEIWKDAISSIIENHTSKTVKEVVEELIEKYVPENIRNFDYKNIDYEQEGKRLLSKLLTGSDAFLTVLPNGVDQDENHMTITWENGLIVTLENENELLSGVKVNYEDISLSALVSVEQEGVYVEGEYYDLTNLAPVLSFADNALLTKKLSGFANVRYKDYVANVRFDVDFEDELIAKISIENDFKNITLYATMHQAYVVIDDIVIEIDIDNIENYKEQIENIFEVEIPEIEMTVDIADTLVASINTLKDVKLESVDDAITVIEYLTHKATIDAKQDELSLTYQYDEISADAKIALGCEEIVLPYATDTLSSILAKAENLKTYIENGVYAVAFNIDKDDFNVYGNVQADVENKKVALTAVYNGHTLNVNYQDETVFVSLDRNKIKAEVARAKDLFALVTRILEENGIEIPEIDLKDYLPEIEMEENVIDYLKDIGVSLFGSFDNLSTLVSYKADDIYADIKFANNNLKSVRVQVRDIDATFNILPYGPGAIDSNDYYDILCAQRGFAKVKLGEIEQIVNIEFDLNSAYLKASTTLLDEDFSVVILEDKAYLYAGDIIVCATKDEIIDLVKELLKGKEIALPEFNLDDIDINTILSSNIYSVRANLLKVELEDVYIELSPCEELAFVEPAQAILLDDISRKIENVKDAIENKTVEFDIEIAFEEYALEAKVKFDGETIEVLTEIEDRPLRVVVKDETIYISYANVKLKYNFAEVVLPEIDIEALKEKFGDRFEFDFEIIDKIKRIVSELKSYTLEDALYNVKLNLAGDKDNILISADTNEEILDANIAFENDKLSKVELTLLGEVNIKLENIAFETQIAEIGDGYYDLENLMPVADIAKEIIEKKQISGVIKTELCGRAVEINYVFDFADKIKAKATISLLGEEITLHVNDKDVTLQIGEVLARGNLDEIEDYLARVDEIFGTKLAEKNLDLPELSLDSHEVIEKALEVLDEINIYSTDEKNLVAEYDGHKIEFAFANGTIKANYSKDFDVLLTASVTESEITIPSTEETIFSLLEKAENLKNYVEGRKYALEFDLAYENLSLSGVAMADLENERVSLELTYNGKFVKATYQDGMAYVEDEHNKVQLKIDNVKSLLAIILPILEANGIDLSFDIDVEEILEDVFGENVLNLTLEEVIERLCVSVNGAFDDLSLEAALSGNDLMQADVNIKFVGNDLKHLQVNVADVSATVELLDFDFEQINAAEYYNFLSAQEGSVKVKVRDYEIVADIKLDLSGDIYIEAGTTLLGENFEIVIENNMLYITFGDLALGADFEDAKEIASALAEVFGFTLPEISSDFDVEIIKDLDINEILSDVTFDIHADTFKVTYKDISLELLSGATFDHDTPQTYSTVENLVDKIKNAKKIFDDRLIEAKFDVDYNGFEFVGEIKYGNDILEVSVDVVGTPVVVRLENKKLYFTYGNMKCMFDVSNTKTASIGLMELLNKIVDESFPVEVNFGIFEEIVSMLLDYDAGDYLENILLDIDGNIDDINVRVSKKRDITNLLLTNIEVKFADDKLSEIDLKVFDLLTANIRVSNVTESTIEQFNAAEYEAYSTDFTKGLLDSLKVREDIYAFSGDIDVRYSNNAFHGKLTAMLKYDENANTILGHYIPALQIYTSALGLETYIYIVDQTIYLDVHGLQIYADLNTTTIEEVLGFVDEYFGMSVDLENASISSLATFRYILPAIDEIYGSWLSVIEGGVAYNGVQVLFDDDFWYGTASKFEKTILQVFVDNQNNTILPRKIMIGANIIDPNTTIYDSYADYVMDVETNETKDLNFAGYLTNINVGRSVSELGDVFVQNGNDIVALKSNYGTTALGEFNSYSTVLDMAKSLIDFAKDMKYQVSVDGAMSGKTTTKLGANINVEIGDLGQNEINNSGFELFDGKYLKVQGAISIKSAVEHLLNVYYESKDSSAIYATYTHGSFIGSGSTIKQRIANASNTFKAKIKNSSLSEIFSMVAKFANLDLGEKMEESLGLVECNTDFAYLQKLLGMERSEEPTTISQGDQIVRTIEDVTKLLRNIKLSTVGDTTTLSVSAELNENIAKLSIIFKKESGVMKLRQIKVENLVFGGNTLNVTINIEDFNANNFDYNKNASHIDVSDISSFIDVAVSTINTQNWQFKGSTTVSLGGGLYTIGVGFDIYVSLDENNKLYMYIELDVEFKASVTGQALPNPDYTVYIVGGGYDRRTSIIEYKNDYLTVAQHTYGVKTTLFSSKEDKHRGYGYGDNWRYHKDQIAPNMMVIMAEALGLSETAYDIIKTAINSVEAHPTIEEAFLGFAKTSSGYSLTINAENLTGMNGVENMTLNIGTSAPYRVRINGVDQGDHRFIDSITTELKIGSILSIPVTLNSVNGTSYRTNGNKTLYTNDHYRKAYAYQIKTLSFETNCSQYVAPIVNPAAEAISIPSLTNFVTDDGVTQKTYTFDGWWTTASFKEGTRYESNLMPNENTVLYAKWIVDTKYYRTVNFVTNSDQSVASVYDLEGTTFALPELTNYVVDDGVTKTYYSFDGWYDNADLSGNVLQTGTVKAQNSSLYASWSKEVEYYRTISFVTNYEESVNSITQLVGTTITIPTLEKQKQETVGNITTFYRFDGWWTTSDFVANTKFTSTKMPESDTTLYAKWDVEKTQRSYQVALYDNGTQVDAIRAVAGESFSLAGLNKVSSTTKFYSDANYATQMTSFVMPERDLNVYIRNQYTLTYSYYAKENNDYVKKTATKVLYQGENFGLPAQTDTYIDYKNSSNELSYRKYFDFGAYSNVADGISVMPNYDYTISNTMSTSTKNYYTVSFDMSLDYIPKSCAAGCHYNSTPATPSSLRVLEGTVVNLKESKYQITVKICATAVGWTKYTYKSTTWGTSKHSDYSDGGNGVTSWTVTGNVTLKPYWKKQ